MRDPFLSLGMASFRDPLGVWLTVQSLRLHQQLNEIPGGVEILVVDNASCAETRTLCAEWGAARYVLDNEIQGTARPRQTLFEQARGRWVLCLDSHVLLWPGSLIRLARWLADHPTCQDLLQGPVVFDDLTSLATHLSPVWGAGMWGTWALDQRGKDPSAEPFEVPMQGLGLFCCRRDAWPGFHPGLRGFGGEEGYIHAKFRRLGRKTLCLPFLRWCHKFRDPRSATTPYANDLAQRLRNYLLGHLEVGLPIQPVLSAFRPIVPDFVLTGILREFNLPVE